MKWLLAVALAAQAWGQLALFELRGSVEVPLGPVFDFGSLEAGEQKATAFRIRNQSAAKVTLTTLQVRGAGFSLPSGQTFLEVAPGKAADIEVVFSAQTPADYSATLQVNSLSVFLVARVTPGPLLTVFPVCAIEGDRTIDFGTLARGEQRVCNLQLQNPSTAPLVITTLAVAGAAFTGPGLAVPFTLNPGQAVPFTIRFAPAVAGTAAGTLTVLSRSYTLRGAATEPALPRPLFDVGPAPFASAQQRTLAVRLAQPAPYSATGLLEMTFQPDATLAPGDLAVAFLPSLARSVPFEITQGSAEVRIAGANSITLQTGTTAGRIRLALTGPPRGFTSDPTTVVTIPAAPIALDSITGGRKGGALELWMIGFDNTYTAGSMAFRFFDRQGNPMGEAIPADFINAFRAFYSGSAGGSAFSVIVTFPVTGDASGIGAVEADLANSAGLTRTQRVTFP